MVYLSMDLPLISVLIPALNEAQTISQVIASTRSGDAVETIVVDGGSWDGTPEVARSCGAMVLNSASGRARQMNCGARLASGEILLFLHADTCLCEEFDRHVRQILARPGVGAGAFQLKIDDSSLPLRVIERVAGWRAKLLQMPYGDQTIFLKTEIFRRLNGFSEIPIMEDFELVRRLRREGRIVIAPAAVVTSARRWRRVGPYKTTLINQLAVIAFCLGVSPERIVRWYHSGGLRSRGSVFF